MKINNGILLLVPLRIIKIDYWCVITILLLRIPQAVSTYLWAPRGCHNTAPTTGSLHRRAAGYPPPGDPGPVATATPRPPGGWRTPIAGGRGTRPPAIRGRQPPPRHAPPAAGGPPSPGGGGRETLASIGAHITYFPLNINYNIPGVYLLPAILPVSSSPLGQKFETMSLGACTPFVMFTVISCSHGWISVTSLLIVNINKYNKY